MNTPPSVPSTLPLTIAQQIDAVCEQFEAAWQTGQRPDLAAFVGAGPDSGRRKLVLELIRLDVFYRRQAGETLTANEYQARFPDLDPELVAAAATVTDSPISPSPSPAVARVKGYDLGAELGRGGMGVVYQARHTELNRTVALKMIRAGEFASKAEQERFHIEAEAVARLQHPNIVQVFEVGEWTAPGGTTPTPFFALEYVAGGTLATKWNRTPQPARQAAELMEVLARAVHHAHEKGIVHRDLKPANVLLAPDGTPKVTDFGLAKRLDVEDHHTRTGAILGTPSYMSPEQATGDPRAIGPAADVWALGAMLYECLTGNPPFKGESPITTLELVRTQEPVPLRRVLATVPRDLETICLKCLTKEPSKRYPSAAALAEDLRRYLDGRPIVARPVSTWERAWKFVCRRPWASAFAAVAAASLLAALTILAVSNAEVRSAYQGEKSARQELDGKNAELTGVNATLTRTVGELDEANRQVTSQKTVAENALRDKTAALDVEERTGYYRTIALAYRELEANNVTRFTRLLDDCPPSLRNWEWHFLRRLRNAAAFTVVGTPAAFGVAFSPDDRRLATSGNSGLQVWDLATGRMAWHRPEMVGEVKYNSDGTLLAVQQRHELALLLAGTGEDAFRIDAFPGGGIIQGSFAFSGDGRRLAVAGPDAVRVWDVPGQKLAETLPVAEGDPRFVALSHDGRRLAAFVSKASVVLVWDVATKAVTSLVTRANVDSLAFGPDAHRLLVGNMGSPGGAFIYDLRANRRDVVFRGHIGMVRRATFTPDGKRVVTAGHLDLTVKTWDAATGQLLRTYLAPTPSDPVGNPGWLMALAVTRDGGRVAVALSDGHFRVWDHGTPAAVLALAGEPVVVRAPNTRPPTKAPATAWNPADGAEIVRACGLRRNGPNSSVSPDGRVRLDAMAPGKPTPDGRPVLFMSNEARLIGRQDKSGQPVVLRGHEKPIHGRAFSADSALVATGDDGGDVRVWRTEDGSPVRRLTGLTTRVSELAFSPDGRRLAAAGWGELIVWDVGTGDMVASVPGLKPSPSALALTADGRLLLTGDTGGQVRFVELPTGAVRQTLVAHRGRVIVAGFLASPDRAYSYDLDGVLKVWDTRHGQEILSVPGLKGTQPDLATLLPSTKPAGPTPSSPPSRP